MHLYVTDELARSVRRRAKQRGLSVSRYLAELVQSEVSDDWDEGFFEEVFGGWVGELERPDQLEFETREDFS